MLFVTSVDIWTSKKPAKLLKDAWGTYFLLNTNRIIEMRVKGTDDTKFWYAQDPDDARDSPDYLECGASRAVITAWHDATADSKFVSLDIFPNMDITQTAVATTIEWADIAYIYQTYRDVLDNVAHMTYYANAFQRVECIIEHNLLGILALQNAH